jgi:hypothetical protein
VSPVAALQAAGTWKHDALVGSGFIAGDAAAAFSLGVAGLLGAVFAGSA